MKSLADGQTFVYLRELAFTSADGTVRRLDVKEIKEMASTVRVLTDCVRSLYGIPTFGETSRLYLAGKSEKPDSCR